MIAVKFYSCRSRRMSEKVEKKLEKVKSRNKGKGVMKKTYQWVEDESIFKSLQCNRMVNAHAKVDHLEGKRPFDIWVLVFIKDIEDNVTKQTMFHAKCDKVDHNFYIMNNKIYQFLEVILFSGYHHVPSEQDF